MLKDVYTRLSTLLYIEVYRELCAISPTIPCMIGMIVGIKSCNIIMVFV